MGELVGYMRVSTKEQTFDLQQDALLTAGVVERYLDQDIASSSVARRLLSARYDTRPWRLRRSMIWVSTSSKVMSTPPMPPRAPLHPSSLPYQSPR